MEMLNDIAIIAFKDTSAWEKWLHKNCTLQTGVWIKIAKKVSGIPSITHAEALDVALCYGWIDGQGRSLDDTYYLQKFTPRRAKSLWSKINIGKTAALIKAGLMQPPGYAAIAAAQADGRWDAAYEPQRTATVPPDFAAALAKQPKARGFFDSLSKADQYSFLWRLMTAKTPETRNKRLRRMLTMLEAGKQFHS